MDIDQLLNSVTSQIVDFLNEPDPIQIKNAVLYIVAGMCGLKFLKTLSSAYLLRKRLNFLPTAPTEILPWRMGGEKPGHTFDSHKIGNDAVVIFNRFMDICQRSWAKDDHNRGINTVWLSPRFPIVYLFSPESAEALLRSNTNINKAFAYDMLHPWLGTGLLTAEKKKWKPRRRMITPTFHFNILQDFLEVMNKQTTFMADKLLNECRAGKTASVDMYSYITLAALDIICETAMGHDLKSQQRESNSDYISSIYLANKVIVRRLRYPYLIPDFTFNLFDKDAKQYWAGIKLMKEFTLSIIQKRISERLTATSEHVGEKKKRAFLDLLIDEYEQGAIDLDGIREEVDTFMFEGHDTTSAAINMAFYHIAKDTRVRENLQQEVDEVFRGDVTRDVTNDDLGKMPYVEAFIREILRLYPSVPMMLRNLSEDLVVNDGVTIPKNTSVAIQAYYVHRDPKHWGDDANECKPERFMDDGIKRHAYAWIPFAAGARNCVGQRFAMMEMKMQVASVIRRLDFRLADGESGKLTMYGDMILRPWENPKLKITERTEFAME